MTIDNLLLHLNACDGIGAQTMQHIHNAIEQNQCTPEELYSSSAHRISQLLNIPIKRAQKVVHGLSNREPLDLELMFIQKYNLHIITLADANYPEYLRNIHLPPPVLYYKGAPLACKQNRMAVVGSRKATSYASMFIKRVIPDLVSCGWQIVSGGARGADTMAHEATLHAGGSTVVVLGCGLGTTYPPENRDLFERVAEQGGTIISSFSYATKPDRWLFPARNRIIAGLSAGCIVAQAAAKSGALITAEFALEQGRQVFALPGLIDEPLSAGCHSLIQQGAKLVTGSTDILEEFGQESIKNKEVVVPSSDPFLQFLQTPQSFDQLVVATGMPIAELHTKLFALQCEGAIEQNFAGLWEITSFGSSH